MIPHLKCKSNKKDEMVEQPGGCYQGGDIIKA